MTMESTPGTAEPTLVAALWLIAIGFAAVVQNYLSQKGKNLATKEDVAEITRAIESVKHENALQVERVRAEASAKLEEIKISLGVEAESRRLLQQRAEKLYLAVERFHTDFASYTSIFQHHADGEINWSQALDIVESTSRDRSRAAIDDMTMLTHMHFPSLVPKFERLMSARDATSNVIQGPLRSASSKAYSSRNTDPAGSASELRNQTRAFFHAIQDYKKAILEIARSLNDGERQSIAPSDTRRTTQPEKAGDG